MSNTRSNMYLFIINMAQLLWGQNKMAANKNQTKNKRFHTSNKFQNKQ